eukprot:GEMP01053607.1.p1 GENE.GEMP01053607.1~~GEMP01053607.1.p1  ORF type:complete len:332 (+),score=59.82 GEMP01053607.1:100-996(+)
MPRHSKNATDRPFATRYELSQSFFNFTQEERIGAESHLPFGYCSLSMKAPSEPVVTPDGYIFDRNFIVEYMAVTKNALLEKKEEYESDQRRKAAVEKLDEAKQQLQDLQDFDNVEHSVVHSTECIKGRTTFENLDKTDCRKKNFWMASEAPTSAPTAKENVIDLTVRCPMSNKRLRMRDLYPVEFSLLHEQAQKTGGERGMYCCEVTKQPITVQQAYYLKPSRKVVLESVLKRIVHPTMTCPTTNKKLKDSDIIKLQKAGTSFCSNNGVLVKGFRLLNSQRQSLGERFGSLGKKGTVL